MLIIKKQVLKYNSNLTKKKISKTCKQELNKSNKTKLRKKKI